MAKSSRSRARIVRSVPSPADHLPRPPAEACGRYAEIRERLLAASTAHARPSEETLSEIAAVLRFLSGAYEQSARAATTL